MSNVPKNVQGEGLRTPAPLTVHALAQAKRLQLLHLRQLGLLDTPDGVSIPYYDEMHREIACKHRTALVAGAGSYWAKGVPLSAYGRWRLVEAREQKVLLLVEGESDCWTLWHYHIPALGIPGSHCFKTLEAHMLDHVERVYLHIEPDAGGQAFETNGLRRLAELKFAGSTFLFRMPAGIKDPSELHLDGPEHFVERLGAAMLSARPATPTHLMPLAKDEGVPHEPAAPPDAPAVCFSVEEVNLSDVESEQVQWLCQGRIPLGKLTILDGDPGLGKSSIALDIAARLTRGAPMPGDTVGELQDCRTGVVVLMTAEDGLGDTIRPRLEAAGAVLERIVALKSMRLTDERRRPLAMPMDIPAIAKIVKDANAKLVIIDPLMAYLDESVSAHNDQSIRRALLPLSEMAEQTGAAVLVIRHLNKQPGKNALYRGGGSIGIIGAARSGLLVVKDNDAPHQRLLGVSKCNLCKKPPTLRYELTTPSSASSGSPKVHWLSECDTPIEEYLDAEANSTERDGTSEGVEFLKARLQAEPIPATQLFEEAAKLEIGKDMLKRAKKKLGVLSQFVKSEGEEAGHWVWSKAS